MMTFRPAIFALLAMMALSAGGCKWSRRTPALIPPPTPVPASAPAASQPASPAPVVPPPNQKPEPAQETAPPAPHPAPPAQVVHPPKPKPEPAQAPAQPHPSPPAFGQILTPQQQTELRRSYQQSAQFARQTLSQLSGHALSQDQADTANRVRSFLSQADEAQSKDPSVAAQLARRAELLARDLLNSFR
jgi:outer membrane biosynthesis protein TonB